MIHQITVGISEQKKIKSQSSMLGSIREVIVLLCVYTKGFTLSWGHAFLRLSKLLQLSENDFFRKIDNFRHFTHKNVVSSSKKPLCTLFSNLKKNEIVGIPGKTSCF